MSDIAKKAGVSVNTVSLSLKNSHRVKKETQEKILRLADEMGYRTDPLVRRLMQNIRTQKPGSYRATIGVVDFLPEGVPAWKRALVDHNLKEIRYRAQQWGYQTDLISLHELKSPPRMVKVLEHRGISGILIVSGSEADLPEDFPWRSLSAVTLSPALFPGFHHISPNFFHNLMMTLDRVKKKGYQRIGLIEQRRSNVISRYQISSAFQVYAENHSELDLLPPAFPETLVKEAVVEWFQRGQPEVVLSQSAYTYQWLLELGLRIPEDVGFVNLGLKDHLVEHRHAGVDKGHAELIRRAVGMLVGMMEQNETGMPASPSITLVEGTWVEGETLMSRK